MEERNVDLYEAIAGLFEEVMGLRWRQVQRGARKPVLNMLERGGKQK